MRSVGAEQQDGAAQRVPVAVELLRPHGGEQVGEDLADVAVDPLQRHIHTLARRLVQEALQASDVWRKEEGRQLQRVRVKSLFFRTPPQQTHGFRRRRKTTAFVRRASPPEKS